MPEITRKRPCVTFAESLNILRIDDNGAQYGLALPNNQCTYKWSRTQRDGWIRALLSAEITMYRELGSPVCPQEICNETHYVGHQIKLRHTPVAYLGKRVFSDWRVADVAYDDDVHSNGVVRLCVSDVPSVTQYSSTTAVTGCATVGGQPNQLDLTVADLEALGEVVAGVQYLAVFTDSTVTSILATVVSYNASTNILRLEFATAVDCSYGSGVATVARYFTDYDPDFSLENILWDYPAAIATYYRGAQTVQEPIGPIDISDCGFSAPYGVTGCATVGGQPNQLDLTIADLEVAWGDITAGDAYTVNLLDGTTVEATAVSYDDITDTLRLDFGFSLNCSYGTGVDEVIRHLYLEGYEFSWPGYQLIKPEVDETQADEDANFLASIRWQYTTVDESLAYEFVGECNCWVCATGTPSLALTLEDGPEGIVCITNATCTARGRRIRINYATAFDCNQDDIAPDLKDAVIYIALTITGQTEVKPCGCDNNLIDDLLKPDLMVDRAFAAEVRFDGTKAGMKAQRIINQVLNRPVPDRDIASAGIGRVRSSGFWSR